MVMAGEMERKGRKNRGYDVHGLEVSLSKESGMDVLTEKKEKSVLSLCVFLFTKSGASPLIRVVFMYLYGGY